MLESRRSRPIGGGAVTCRHGRAALPDAARPSRRPPRRVRRAVSDTRGSKVEVAEAEEAKIVARTRTPTRPYGAASRGRKAARRLVSNPRRSVEECLPNHLTARVTEIDVAALGKVGGIFSAANYGIYRQRHANTAAAPRAVAPRGLPVAP